MVFLKVLRKSQKSTNVRVSFLINFQACIFIEKLYCFSANFATFLKPFFTQSTSGRLLLEAILNNSGPEKF